MGIIYKIIFPNNKIYIGQTMHDLETRQKQHKNALLKGKDYPVYKAMKKYGWENLKWEIIDYADTKEELNQKEIYWIDKMQSYIKFKNSHGYNCTLGGDSVSVLTALTIEELQEFILDCKNLKSKKYLINKYKISSKLYYKIIRGYIWSQYTHINKLDNEENNSILNRFQVDFIISEFKESGDYKKIAKFLEVSPNVVLKVLKGQTWRNYTGIPNNFFIMNSKKSTKLSPNQIIEIVKEYQNGANTNELSLKYNVSIGYVQGLVSGRSNSNITNIVYKSKNNLQKENFINSEIYTNKP